ncbi:DUF547 domain-containing protein [Rheinheimera sp.]|uniref:DUF547 domain-containing protein n=1 Tax=Rheinheimera sp. TaxID=1869214 RepID=UPI00307DD9F7
MKTSWLVLPLIVLFAWGIEAREQELPAHWFGDDPNSKIVIDYADWDFVLRSSVLLSGPVNRQKAKAEVPHTGTRLTNKYKTRTILAGNKFHYEQFRKLPELNDNVSAIRQSLQQLPSEVALNTLTANEQLAYWLNLYNLVVIDEINKVYPKKYLEEFVTAEGGLLQRKLLKIEGVQLSLNDIQHKVLKVKFDHDPLVLYGLYQGYIGSPSIRKFAYTGENVMRALQANAFDFINSNRGTYPAGDNFLVSSFYQRNAGYFPNFQQDLRTHLNQYLKPAEKDALQDADTMYALIDDWIVTDIYGTRQEFGGGSSVNITKINGDPYLHRFPPELLKYLVKLQQRNDEARGTVSIKDLEAEPSEN